MTFSLAEWGTSFSTPVFLMTGHQEESNYPGEGKSLLLLKPFSLDMLVEVVRGTLAAQGIVLKREALAA